MYTCDHGDLLPLAEVPVQINHTMYRLVTYNVITSYSLPVLLLPLVSAKVFTQLTINFIVTKIPRGLFLPKIEHCAYIQSPTE